MYNKILGPFRLYTPQLALPRFCSSKKPRKHIKRSPLNSVYSSSCFTLNLLFQGVADEARALRGLLILFPMHLSNIVLSFGYGVAEWVKCVCEVDVNVPTIEIDVLRMKFFVPGK